MELRKHLIKTIDASQFYANEVNYDGENKVACPFHSEVEPSFDVRGDGSSICYGCGKKFRNIIEFYIAYHEVSFNRALYELFSEYVSPLIARTTYTRMHGNLRPMSSPYRYLTKRGIGKSTMEKYLLGWDGERITIPVFNEWGYCVNIRRAKYKKSDAYAKMISYKKGYGSNRLYPLSALLHNPIFIFEGEMDTLLAIHLGLNGITLTGGCNSWKERFAVLFKNKNVYICYDNDKPGRLGADTVARDIVHLSTSVKRIDIPTKYGKDFSDYMEHRPITAFHQLIENSYCYRLGNRPAKAEVDFLPEKNMMLELQPKNQTIHLMIKVVGND